MIKLTNTEGFFVDMVGDDEWIRLEGFTSLQIIRAVNRLRRIGVFLDVDGSTPTLTEVGWEVYRERKGLSPIEEKFEVELPVREFQTEVPDEILEISEELKKEKLPEGKRADVVAVEGFEGSVTHLERQVMRALGRNHFNTSASEGRMVWVAHILDHAVDSIDVSPRQLPNLLTTLKKKGLVYPSAGKGKDRATGLTTLGWEVFRGLGL